MGRRAFRLRMLFGIAAVAILFACSIACFWRAASEALGRDRRRAETLRTLSRVDDLLAVRGAKGLSLVPSWPETLDPADWEALDLWLQAEAAGALQAFEGVQGGYFVPAADRYLGGASSRRPAKAGGRANARGGDALAPGFEFDLIDDQVREALEKDRPVERLVEMPPLSLAIRAGPLRINGRRVAATWAAIRIDDTDAMARALRSYQWASGLALGGLGLAMAVTFSLFGTIRKQNDEKRRMESEIRRNERLAALGKLLAGVSHELRNPLAGIRSVAQLWQKGIVSDADLAEELIGEVDRLDGIVAQMLQFSRAEPRSLAPCDLNALAAEAARLARPAAEAQGVGVELDLDPSLPPVEIDSAALLRVLRNLTSNALHFQPEGGLIRVSTKAEPGGGGVQVRISDLGPGISPEAREHLFEPFFSTRPGGTGLGLALAREIVLAHRGEIRAEDAPGRGAAFVVRLPLRPG